MRWFRYVGFGVLVSLWTIGGCCPEGEGGFQAGDSALLVVNPDPIAFGSVPVGDQTSITVTLTNSLDASGPLEIQEVSLRDASPDLSLVQPAAYTIAVGDSITVEVVYQPSDGLYDEGWLFIGFLGGERLVKINTLTQLGSLVIQPNPINFGAVGGGVPEVRAVRISNLGTNIIQVGTVSMNFDSSPDYTVLGAYSPVDGTCGGFNEDTALVFPFDLGIEERFCCDLQYLPTGGGNDYGTLEVFPPYDASAPVQTALSQAPVNGVEVGPEITIKPASKLEFGEVAVGMENVVELLVANEGTEDLIVQGITKGTQQEESFAAVEILTPIAAGTVLAPGESTPVSVRFAPDQAYGVVYGPLGFLEVASNDGDEPIAYVTVFGQVAAPELQITPAELVDFGVVALNTTAERTFTMTNTGSVDLIVSDLVITQNSPASEYTVLESCDWQGGCVVGLPALPLTIPAQKYQIIKLTFTNSGGPADELVWGELGFATTHPEGPTKVALRARRTDTAKCEIVLNPVQLNYGTVPYGHEKTMTMNMINVGSAPCSWSHATVHDGAFGMCTAGPVSTSKNFEIVNPPPAIKDLIKPGMSWPLEIKYVPEADLFSSAFEDFFDFTGLVQVHVLDYAQPNGNSPYSEVTAPSAAAGQQAPCNLTGKSGVANVAAIPGDIDFGLTTVGCHSQTKTVTIYNTGKAPLSICDIALEACSPEFKLKEVPPIPACDANGGGILLTQSAPIEVQVVYAPQDTSTDGCSLVVGSNDLDTPALSIPLKGAGTYDDEQTDIFTQLSGQEVDVLFVVDNSGSMSDEQNSLANNFSSFINAAGVWSTDYRVAVVTTDMEEFNDMAGKFMGQPRFVQSGDISGFQGNVQVGDNGSGTEKGLLAAQTALALPLIGQVDPPQTCNTNDDCSSPAECVPSVLNAGQSFCGGWNMEFLRKDATLEVVFVSDEEDGSDASLSFYIDFLKSLKGFANENLMHAHAIVGDAGGCDGPGGSADDGARYREVAQQTGGKFQSICDSNWAQKLEDIGTIAFGLKVQFFLSRPAIPDTITVTVAGQQCPGGWSYDPATNSILFDENHPCMPQEGQSIEVYYEVICYSE